MFVAGFKGDNMIKVCMDDTACLNLAIFMICGVGICVLSSVHTHGRDWNASKHGSLAIAASNALITLFSERDEHIWI